MPPSLTAFIILFLSAALLRAFNLLTRSHAERLAAVVFSVSLPATILVSLDGIRFTATAWKLPVAASLVTLPMLVVAWQVAYLGQTTLTLTLLYGLALWHGTAPAHPMSGIHRFLAAPPLWALSGILLLKLFGLNLPSWLRELLLPLHFTTTPLASLVLGLSISLKGQGKFALAALGVVLRMGGGMLLGFAAAESLRLTGVERAVVVLVAGMPSAVTAVIFAAEAALDEELVASIVALSVGAGVALLPWLPQFARWLMG
jgi:malate permease and related proteins